MRKETPESLKCHICHQGQGLSGKGSCMSIKVLPPNETVAKKTGRASRGQPYPRDPVAVIVKKKGRFGKRSTKSRVVYANV